MRTSAERQTYAKVNSNKNIARPLDDVEVPSEPFETWMWVFELFRIFAVVLSQFCIVDICKKSNACCAYIYQYAVLTRNLLASFSFISVKFVFSQRANSISFAPYDTTRIWFSSQKRGAQLLLGAEEHCTYTWIMCSFLVRTKGRTI